MNHSEISAQTKLNMGLFFIIFLLLGGNSYMDIIEHESLDKRLDEKHLLCLKTYEIKSRHNLVLMCDEVNKDEN